MLIPFNELFARHKIQATRVLHLGANTGQEAAAYAQQGIGHMIWVEALPSLCVALRKHVATIPGMHMIEQACVGDVDGKEVVFNIASNGAQSSSYLEFGTHAKEHPSVRYIGAMKMKMVRVDTLLAPTKWFEEGVWFLNADLQGAELPALRGMGDLLRRFSYAYIEVNEKELYKGCALVKEVDAYLRVFGFVRAETKMTGAGWGDAFYKRYLPTN